MKAEKGWEYGEGYIIRHDGTQSEEQLINEGYSKADWITDKKTVETENFTESSFSTTTERERYFWRPRKKIKAIFQKPHILIKENLGQERIPMMFSEEYLCFKHEIIGIHARQGDIKALKDLYQNLNKNSKTHRFLLLSSSSRAGVSRAISTLLKNDIMNLPYPETPMTSNWATAKPSSKTMSSNITSSQTQAAKTLRSIKSSRRRNWKSTARFFATSLTRYTSKTGKNGLFRVFMAETLLSLLHFATASPLPTFCPIFLRAV